MRPVLLQSAFTQRLLNQGQLTRWKDVWSCFAANFYKKSSDIPSNSLPAIAKYMADTSKNVLVMAGAGLSTHSGIPDFRSPGTGLYDNLQQYNLPYPEAIFDLGFFVRDPRPFLSLAKELYPGKKYRPNLGHYLARLINEKGKLLRMYTQNIDGLERLAGLPPEKLVEAHGGFSSASCISCFKEHDPDETREAIFRGEVIRCTNGKYQKLSGTNTGNKCNLHKYLNSFIVVQIGVYYSGTVFIGLVKPDIVFFGEALPDRFFLYQDDVLWADLLIVIGTSLEVYPFAAIADEVPHDVPRLLLNRDVVGSFGMRKHDTIVTCDIIEGVTRLAKELGWHEELMELYTKHEPCT
ncbi:NAD-dependent protein deacetylase sirtuin-3-like isoform X1 [Schistocerca serialis cubense]|uniref:NAD-dependent protein deacetylase sirtuin-3-like isoform X1 n=1 Tax=Schistocerca serialis cubense TaxID=2023355 RepID=UPI00214E2F62|nr:NAD-dependent protein deacetylase sirtuin-3-like isoform X1 [Schistocerca serialis cubense]